VKKKKKRQRQSNFTHINTVLTMPSRVACTDRHFAQRKCAGTPEEGVDIGTQTPETGFAGDRCSGSCNDLDASGNTSKKRCKSCKLEAIEAARRA
jgi:hypothetical protein